MTKDDEIWEQTLAHFQQGVVGFVADANRPEVREEFARRLKAEWEKAQEPLNVTVWKDGSYLCHIPADDLYCRDDPDWLCSIPLVSAYVAPVAKEPAPCKGKNCGSQDYRFHSADCFAEHEATVNPGGKYTVKELIAEGCTPADAAMNKEPK